MKKPILIIASICLVVFASLAYFVFAPTTNFEEKSKTVIVDHSITTTAALEELLSSKEIISQGWVFSILANQLNVWHKLKPGKFEVKKHSSLLSIVRLLRNNNQSEVKLVINKVRISEDLAHLIGKNFSSDSASVMHFLASSDSLKSVGIDSATLLCSIIPNTYSFYWATPLSKIMSKLNEASVDFWTKNSRTEKATAFGFTPKEICTIASIVEEETNMPSDKGNIASVYMNRYKKGMNLGADPTVKFALKDFTLKRILFQHLTVASPYNTYKTKGLPPGPICTPSIQTLDAVLNAPSTDYLFFVAKPDFSGYSNFSSNFSEHSKFAKQYQQALNAYLLKKQTEHKN